MIGTAFQLTPAQARKLGIDTGSTRTSKPRRRKTTEEEQVQERIQLAKLFVQSITILCENYGWKVGLCRLPSSDPQNDDYPSIKDYEAVPNVVMAWRDCTKYANPRTMQIAWLWEIREISVSQVGEMLRENFLREREAIA